MDSLEQINSRISRVFKNPNINFFIIMNLLLIISCYSFLNSTLQQNIKTFISYPIVMFFILSSILVIGYFNLNIAILVLLLFFIALYSSNNPTPLNNIKSNIEGFTNKTKNNKKDSFEDIDDDEDEEDDDDLEIKKKLSNDQEQKRKIKIENNKNSEKEQEEKEEYYRKLITKNFKDALDSGNAEYKASILDNKKKMLESMLNTEKNTKSKNKRQKEKFQTIEKRQFNPDNEEDTNLIITKKILQDIINRIEYNYESTKYLKKYIKHRLEEVVNINNLLNDDDEE